MTLKPLSLTALLAMAALAGCTAPPSDDGGGEETGQVAFYVKDAPGDEFDSVFVAFHQVQVHRTGGGAAETTTATNTTAATPTNTTATTGTNGTVATTTTTVSAGPEAGWITIVDTNQTVDLKAFQGDAKAFLGDQNISVGKYTQIRIHVTEAYGILNSTGERVNFSVPSDRLRVVGNWEVVQGEVTQLVVDFELEKSIHQTGQGKYMFRPVMKLDVQKKPSLDASDTMDPSAAASSNKARGKQSDRGKGNTNTTTPSA